MKICTKCNVSKSLSSFYKNKNNKDGLSYWCKKCDTIARNLFLKSHPINIWASKTINKHKIHGYIVLFNVKELVSFIGNKSTCEICGKELDFSYGNKKHSLHNSPSLDRINNELELRLDNIQLLCNECNITKGTKDMNTFVKYCKLISVKYKHLLLEKN